MVIFGYYIGGYWWLLIDIILMVIDGYFINGYCIINYCLIFYVIIS
jgi:hypothetical protein